MSGSVRPSGPLPKNSAPLGTPSNNPTEWGGQWGRPPFPFHRLHGTPKVGTVTGNARFQHTVSHPGPCGATLPAPVRRSRARPGPARSATGRGPRSGRRGCDSDHEALPGHDQVGHLPGEGRPAARGRRRAPPRRAAVPSERCSCTRRRNVESPPAGGNQPLVAPGQFVVTTGIGDFWTPTSFANFPICRPRPPPSCDSLHPVNPLTGTAS